MVVALLVSQCSGWLKRVPLKTSLSWVTRETSHVPSWPLKARAWWSQAAQGPWEFERPGPRRVPQASSVAGREAGKGRGGRPRAAFLTRAAHFVEHGMHVPDGLQIPGGQRLVKGFGEAEHVIHILGASDVPIQRLIEGRGPAKHGIPVHRQVGTSASHHW